MYKQECSLVYVKGDIMRYGYCLLGLGLQLSLLTIDGSGDSLPDIESCYALYTNNDQDKDMLTIEQKDAVRNVLINAISTCDFSVEDELSIELSYETDSSLVFYHSKVPSFRKALKKLNPQDQDRREISTKRSIENHLRGAIVPYGRAEKALIQNGFIQLPSSIRRLPVAICQPVVIKQQEAGSCGSRSVVNALALQNLVENNVPISAQNIQYRAQKYEKIHIQNGMTSREQINFARQFKLQHAYVMAILPLDLCNNSQVNKFPFTIIESVDLKLVNIYREAEILENIVTTIRSQRNIIAHFLCHLDGETVRKGHAVVITLIKRASKPTQMVYMDSNNLPIGEHCQAAAYITYLYWQCIA
jgi:hypothetical protein